MKSIHALLFSVLLPAAEVFPDKLDSMFPPEVTVEQFSLERKGVSKLTVGYFFDVSVAAFYQPKDFGPDEALSDNPRHLELHYLRNLSRDAFIDAADDMLQKQHKPETILGIKEGIDQINSLFNDVKKGDRYSLTYIPGLGTELKYNGESKGVIKGTEFARIYFSIWLGENNPYKKFRDRLVGEL